MGKHKYIKEKNKFIKKYKITSGEQITTALAKKAREEIGFSETTTKTDIQVSIGGFIKSKYFNCT